MVMSLPRWLLSSGKSSFVNCSCIVADSIAVLAGVSQANNATPKFDMGPFQKKSLKKLGVGVYCQSELFFSSVPLIIEDF